MKKILTTFLISLTLLTFNNTAFAGFFSDLIGVKKPTMYSRGKVNHIGCKVEYTQLDLTTGLEKTVKHFVQYEITRIADGTNTMYLSAQDLVDKINNWTDENKNNILANMTGINCKEKRFYSHKLFFWKGRQRWEKYKSCEDKYNLDFINLLERPKQWGYNVHKDRLIKDYEEGCKNYEN
jgi:hypothetical protein